MNKVLRICLLGGAVVFLLAACGPNDETVDTAATPGQNTVAEDPTAGPVTEDPVENHSAETVADAFDFLFRETVISLDQNMAEILDALGEPTGMRQTPSCAFDGYDRIFGFGAINIHTYPVGENDFIQIISIRDDSVTTRGGIRLGDNWDRVVNAYGSYYEEDFSIRTFTKGNTTLSFFVENDMVVEITYALIMN